MMKICLAVLTQYRRVTDRQTDILSLHSSRLSGASRGKNRLSSGAQSLAMITSSPSWRDRHTSSEWNKLRLSYTKSCILRLCRAFNWPSSDRHTITTVSHKPPSPTAFVSNDSIYWFLTFWLIQLLFLSLQFTSFNRRTVAFRTTQMPIVPVTWTSTGTWPMLPIPWTSEIQRHCVPGLAGWQNTSSW